MKDIVWLIQHLFRITLRNKKSMLLNLGLPVIGIITTVIIFSNVGESNLQLGIVDEDQTNLSKKTVAFLKELENVELITISKSAIQQKVGSGELDGVIHLQKGFAQAIYTKHPGKIQLIAIKGAEVTGFVKAYLDQYLQHLVALVRASNGNPDTFEKLYRNYQASSFQLHTHTIQDTSYDQRMTYQTIGFLIMFMLLGAWSLTETILREKENRTYYRLLSTPVSGVKYVTANMIVNLIMMSIQILITLVGLIYVFRVETNIAFLDFLLVLWMFALIAISFSLMVLSFAKSVKSGNALHQLLIIPTCLLSGCFWPAEIMPSYILKIADFLPQRWVLSTLTELQEGTKLLDLSINILIFLLFALAFFLIAINQMSHNDDTRTFT